ncbi:MAG: acyl--CoA ligase [Actinobacteria bacterium]|nr:MAG: acyl--CoA ligase [Actinomycetota bacterium]
MAGYAGRSLERPVMPSGLLRAGLDADPDGLALISTQTRWTWSTLDDLSDRLAVSLLGLGLQPGDRIASLMPNRPALIVHYLACFKAGLVVTPLNYRYMAPEIDHALAVSQARALLAHVEREGDLTASQLVRQLPLGTISYGGKPGAGTAFDELIEGEPPFSPPPPSPEAPAVIFFTSGSTGRPKGVTHTQETLGWMFATGAAGLELGPEDRLLAGSSLSHLGAFYLSFAALSVGAGVIVARTFDADELLPLLREDRPTVLSMLPSALFALTRDHGARHDDFASLRLCRAAGDTVSAELEREFTALSGFAIDEAYGLTETGLVTVSPPSGEIRPGSVGQVVPAVSLTIHGDEGEELPCGSEGRLWIKAPAATVGYWDNPGATGAAFRNGWFDSGDLMRVDDEGFFSFCGRKKQIIVHDGSNISPQEVEGALVEHPSVASAAVIGIHDTLHGENVRAYIALKEGAGRPPSQELIQFARARVGYKAPEEIVVLEDMPITATGKLDRTYLKRMAEANVARGADQ